MPLMFQRLAHNFIKNGYYPTDAATLEGVKALLQPPDEGHVRVIDPCCGEGTALAELKQGLVDDGAEVIALGVECDADRAWHAKQLLDCAIHSDIHDVIVSPRSCGLMLLNPPYGDSVSDAASIGDTHRHERLELQFLRRTFSALQFGGVLVYIVPRYAVQNELAAFIARHFADVRFYLAPEERFKQCVIVGYRKRPDQPSASLVQRILDGACGAIDAEVLTPQGSPHYRVPPLVQDPDFRFHAIRIDAAQLSAEISRYRTSTLWPQFGSVFGQVAKDHRAPLTALGPWHLALALAAGQITGVVRSATGRTLFIKGDTFKEKARAVEATVDDEGNLSETVVLTDRFVPVIRGIEFTPGADFGRVITIR